MFMSDSNHKARKALKTKPNISLIRTSFSNIFLVTFFMRHITFRFFTWLLRRRVAIFRCICRNVQKLDSPLIWFMMKQNTKCTKLIFWMRILFFRLRLDDETYIKCQKIRQLESLLQRNCCHNFCVSNFAKTGLTTNIPCTNKVWDEGVKHTMIKINY